MKTILIASADGNLIDSMTETIGSDYAVHTTDSAKGVVGFLRESSLLVMEQTFLDRCGDQFFKGLVERCPLPILLLVAPEEIGTAMRAIRGGVSNYLVKTNGYKKDLPLSIEVTLEKHHAEKKLKTVVSTLQKRVQELESYSVHGNGPSAPSTDPESSILDEIVFIFKRGEINLPSPPQISIKFKEMVHAGANVRAIGGLLKKDAAISSKLISISNSAFYRGVAEHKTLEQAVGRLGLTTTKRYVDVITNRTLYFTKDKRFVAIIEKLWEHSLACAYASQGIAERLQVMLSEDAFTLGLFHDIGRLVLYRAVGELQKEKKIGENMDPEELAKTVDTNHERFGGALLKMWKFSSVFAGVATFHDSFERAEPKSKELLVVHAANLLVKSMGYNLGAHDVPPEACLEGESAKILKLDAQMFDEVTDKVRTHMEELKGYFD